MYLFVDLTWRAVFDLDIEGSTVGTITLSVFCNEGRDRGAMTTLIVIVNDYHL